MAKFLEKIQYPKLILLLTSILVAYLLFSQGIFYDFVKTLNMHGYVATIMAGFLFAYGFTAPLAVGLLIALPNDINIFLASILAGFCAFISDFLIFKFIKGSFQEEFDKLKLTAVFQKIYHVFNNNLSYRIQKYLLWTFAGLIIASPLPDEFGVTLLSGFTEINKKTFAILSFTFNTLGILIILFLSQ